MFTGEHSSILELADPWQRTRLFLARLGIGSPFTRLAIKAEIVDRLHPETADPAVTPTALLKLCDKIDRVPPSERYALLAQPIRLDDASDRRVWFDVITGLTNHHIVGRLDKPRVA